MSGFNDIDTTAEGFLQIQDELAHVQRRSARFHLDQEVHIAVDASVTACDGAEHADVVCASVLRHAEDRMAMDADLV